MSEPITLRGITWNHPRGLDPLLAANDVYREVAPGVRVEWTTRSLSGFGEDPLIELAASYDLLVIDHPFVGDAAASTAFHPLDTLAGPDVLLDRDRASVGPSHASYHYAGHQWAFAIDAAAQVSAVHERFGDARMPSTWDEVFELAAALRRDGLWMAVPMWPADLCVATYTIGNGMGLELFAGGRVFPPGQGEQVLGLLKRLCDASHPDALTWNPPTLLDQMRDGVVHYCPMLFGYSNYSRMRCAGRSGAVRRHPDRQRPADRDDARWRRHRDIDRVRESRGGDRLRDLDHERRCADRAVRVGRRPAGPARGVGR